ncbi:Alpha/Beta hydrolase protein, partial [Mycena floridula]
YNRSAIAQDIIAILDAENVTKAFTISHDWGCAIGSALATYHPSRFKGFAFLAAGFGTPVPKYDLSEVTERFKSLLGYEPFGYWLFFFEDGADKVIEEHVCLQRISIVFPEDPAIWCTDMVPPGALKAWLLKDTKTPPPAYLSEQDREDIKKVLFAGGLAAPLCWYKNRMHGLAAADDEGAPKDGYAIQKPVFFGAALKDYACMPKLGLAATPPSVVPKLTVKEYDSSHWVQLAKPDELNKDLLEWIT